MYQVSRKIFSHHSADLLYAVVNDTASYRDFIPFCSDSQVIKEQEGEKDCLLVFSKGPMSRRLITRNTLKPNQSIEVNLLEGDFKSLHGIWLFEETPNGTWISLEFDYEFSHLLVQHTFGQIFKPLSYELVNTFCQRADELSLR